MKNSNFNNLSIFIVIIMISFIFTACPDESNNNVITGTSSITANPPAGSVIRGTQVTLSCSIDGAELWYTLDGSDPVAGVSGNINIVSGRVTMRYTGPITIGDEKTITVIARNHGSTVDFLSQRYTINQSLSGELLHHWTSKNPGQPHFWSSDNFNNPLMVNGKSWSLWGTAPTESERLPYLNSSGLFIFGGRLMVGINRITPPTSNIIFDENGEFQLASTGLLRFTINYTNQGYGTGQQARPLGIFLNNNTISADNSVHGSASGSIVNTTAAEPVGAPATLVWNINLRDLRNTQTSADALKTSFFQIFGGDGPTLIDSFFIEYRAPSVLTSITISGEDTVQASTSEVTRQITLTAIQNPSDADSDILWSVGASVTYTDSATVAGVASINQNGVLTGLGTGEVWVFARGMGTEITASHKVTVTEFAHIPVTSIAINSVPADAITVMAGDGGSNPGRVITFSASPIPAINDDIPMSTNPWVWNLRSSEDHDSPTVNPAIATLTGSGPNRSLTGIFVEEPTDVWVFVSNTEFGIRASRKITVIPYEEMDWELVWEWKKEDMTGSITIGNTAASTINNVSWRKFNAQGGTTVVSQEGIVLGQNQRLLIGTNSNAPTGAESFHSGGQFDLGTTGKARIRVIGTRTNNTFEVALNWAVNASTINNQGAIDTVHGVNAAAFSARSSLPAGTSGILINLELDLDALADLGPLSTQALSSSFICLRSQNNAETVITVDSITIERVQ
jgi:hypothetical protein